jgi:hypothetical protein
VRPWFRVGDDIIRTIGMVARFDAADVTLDELRIELTYRSARLASPRSRVRLGPASA